MVFWNTRGSPISKGYNFSPSYPSLFANFNSRNVLFYCHLYLKRFIVFGVNDNFLYLLRKLHQHSKCCNFHVLRKTCSNFPLRQII